MSVEAEELRRAAEAAGLGAEPAGGLYCPTCGAGPFEKQISLKNHQRAHAKDGAAGARERGPSGAGVPAGFKAELDKAVTNTIGAGVLLANVSPHMGITIAGVQDRNTKEWVVKSRAVVTGEILLSYAQGDAERAAQIYRLLRAYNRVFESGAIFEVGASLGAAAIADGTMIRASIAGQDPSEAARQAAERTVRLPLVGDVPLVRMAIPDVVEFVQENMLEPPAEPGPTANGSGRQRRKAPAKGAEVVEGGVTNT